jgi:hypothetical protein
MGSRQPLHNGQPVRYDGWRPREPVHLVYFSAQLELRLPREG